MSKAAFKVNAQVTNDLTNNKLFSFPSNKSNKDMVLDRLNNAKNDGTHTLIKLTDRQEKLRKELETSEAPASIACHAVFEHYISSLMLQLRIEQLKKEGSLAFIPYGDEFIKKVIRKIYDDFLELLPICILAVYSSAFASTSYLVGFASFFAIPIFTAKFTRDKYNNMFNFDNMYGLGPKLDPKLEYFGLSKKTNSLKHKMLLTYYRFMAFIFCIMFARHITTYIGRIYTVPPEQLSIIPSLVTSLTTSSIRLLTLDYISYTQVYLTGPRAAVFAMLPIIIFEALSKIITAYLLQGYSLSFLKQEKSTIDINNHKYLDKVVNSISSAKRSAVNTYFEGAYEIIKKKKNMPIEERFIDIMKDMDKYAAEKSGDKKFELLSENKEINKNVEDLQHNLKEHTTEPWFTAIKKEANTLTKKISNVRSTVKDVLFKK